MTFRVHRTVCFRGVARLKPGVTLAQANDDIARMIPLIPEQFPLEPGLTREMWDGAVRCGCDRLDYVCCGVGWCGRGWPSGGVSAARRASSVAPMSVLR